MSEHHPPANRYWHQGFGKRAYPGGEIVVFSDIEQMLAVLGRSMLCGFLVEPVIIEYGDGDRLYGFREVPKSQIRKKKGRARVHGTQNKLKSGLIYGGGR